MKKRLLTLMSLLLTVSMLLGNMGMFAGALDEQVTENIEQANAELLEFSQTYNEMAEKSEKKYRLIPTENSDYSTARVIISPKRGDLDLSAFDYVDMVRDPQGVYIVQFASPSEAEDCVKQVSDDKNVKCAEPDRLMSACLDENPLFSEAAAYSHYSWGVSYIGADKYADYLIGKNVTSQIIVAVVDSGIISHELLNGKTVAGIDYTDNDTNPADDNGHGTHVSGTIVDCMQGLNVKIMPVRALKDNGEGKATGYTTHIANGIRYAAQNGAKVINLSIGGGHSGNYLEDAISEAINAGVSVVVSAGNEKSDTSNYCPAHITEAITVSALNSNGEFVSRFSNYGSAVDVIAPGEYVTSCYPCTEGYKALSGTSMSAPHVSAAVAMLKLANPSATPAQLQSMIKQYVTDLGSSGWDKYYGYGVVNLTKAIPATETLSSIAVTTQPNKTTYYIGDSFSTSGMVVKAVYANGTTKAVTGYTCSPSSFASVGSQNVTISYKEGSITKTATVPITVKTPSITVSPSTINVKVGQTVSASVVTEPAGQSFGLSIVNVSHTSFSNTGSSISFTGNSVGTDTLYLVMTYNGKQYKSQVSVVVKNEDVTLTSLTLQSAPTKTLYYLGDSLDLTGLRLKATYSNGTTKTVTESEFNANATLSSAGTKTVTLNYTDNSVTKTVSFQITVKSPFISFSPNTIDVAVGDMKTVTMTYEPAMELSMDESVSGYANWEINDELVPDSKYELNVYGSTKGTVVYTVTGVYNGVVYSATLTVNVGTPINGFEYNIVDSGVEISGYTGSGGNVTIPSTINGYPVTSIGDWAFWEKSEITAVTIPNGVKSIGYAAFYYCVNITSISVPNSVTFIDEHAFNACTKLQNIQLPSGIKSLSQSVFCGCESLKSVTIPAGVTEIDMYAFLYCRSLTSVTVPEGVVSLELDAFYGCDSLKSLTLPKSIQTVGDFAFGWTYDPTVGEYSILVPGFVVRCYENSAVHEKAKKDGINYQLISDEKTLTNISIRTMPTKTIYDSGEVLNTDGLSLNANFSDGSSIVVGSGFICDKELLTNNGTTEITVQINVSYTYNGVKKTTPFNVTVRPIQSPNPTVTVSTIPGSKNGTVSIPVTISKNPGIISMDLSFSYDSTKLELLGVQNGNIFKSSDMVTSESLSQIPYSASWADALSTENYTGNGTLITLNFKVKATAADGLVPVTVTLNPNGILNQSLKKVTFQKIDGGVNITSRIPGDADNSGEVDMADAIIIRRYIAKWSSAVSVINLSNADVDASGEVDIADYILLRRHLAGWNVVLL